MSRGFVVGVLCKECDTITFDDPCSHCGHPFPADIFNYRKVNGCTKLGEVCGGDCVQCTYFLVGEEVFVIQSNGINIERGKIDTISCRNIGIDYMPSGNYAGKYPFNIMKTKVLKDSCLTCRNRCKSDMRCPLYQE